jgi:hypothetical protein
VGGGLSLLVHLVLRLPHWSHDFNGLACHREQPWGCLGLAVLGICLLAIALIALPWPLLALAGVRPAWQPAGVGALTVLAGYFMYGALIVNSPLRGGVAASVLLPAILYAAAALATGDTWRGPRKWLAVAAVVILYPIIVGTILGYGVPSPYQIHGL